jgi:AraC family transcriptional regulator of adaptative response / DNA-3-methyladenine glycosylase II
MSSDRFYEALRSRDPRFDGRFFAGVTSTGIYCRPICAARTPRRENVRFFECAAAAESAGFRPCRRCRPETVPGTPAWLGTSVTVSRALRLISQGALDGGDVDSLSDRLGVGSRHLRRLFERHLGASPLAVAQTRRLHFARRLLDQTQLPMREVAYSSGFKSVKRFNTVVRETFGMTPTELRGRSRDRDLPDGAETVKLRLPYREPYDWPGMLDYLAARAIPGVEQVQGDVYRRTIAYDGTVALLEVRPCPGKPCVILEVSASARRHLMSVAERVRRLFDLTTDPVPIAEHLGRDPGISAAVKRRPGLRVPGAWDPFELAIRAILGQQVSVKGATTLAGRLASRYGTPVPGADPSGPHRIFPDAAALADADLSSIGMPGKRADAVRELARLVRDGSLPLSWGECADDTHDGLMAIPGIGEWTARYIAMRALGQPDAFLPGDLGVRKAMANGSGKLPSPADVLARSEKWRPWRAYAVLHLWMSTPGEPRPAKEKQR